MTQLNSIKPITDALFLNIFFTLYTVAHLVNTTLHSYVNKCTTVLENKNIYLPRCSCVGRTKTSTTQSFQTLAQKGSSSHIRSLVLHS